MHKLLILFPGPTFPGMRLEFSLEITIQHNHNHSPLFSPHLTVLPSSFPMKPIIITLFNMPITTPSPQHLLHHT